MADARGPELRTDRLRLRPLAPDDAPAVAAQAGDRRVADTTISVPHPLDVSRAREWLADLASDPGMHLAVRLAGSSELIGAVSLRDLDAEHAQGELSFWIGPEWWGRGYASEGARALTEHGFRELDLNRIYAHHMVRNPASGRVLARLGFRREGLLRERVRKWGRYEDVLLWARLVGDTSWRSLPRR